jgi:mycoredoxin
MEVFATVRGCTDVTSTFPSVTVFWRPGCPYCWRLRTKLKQAGVHVDEINIWEDPAGAAFVRSVTGGDETVPTVRIGTRSLVNPSPRRLLEAIREESG